MSGVESKKNKKYRNLSKNIVLFLISSFGSKMVSFLLVPIYTSMLATEEYGTADLMSSTASLLIPLLTLNIQDAVLRYALDKLYKQKAVFSFGIRVINVSIIFLSLGMLICRGLRLFVFEWYYYLFLLLMYVTSAFNNTLTMYLKAQNRVSIISIGGILNTAIVCIMNICLLLFWKLGIVGFLIAQLSGNIFMLIFQIAVGSLYKDIAISTDTKLGKEMIAYSKPLVLNSISWWINSASDRYILTAFHGAAANGIYSVSYKIPTILSAIQNVFYNAWSISAITEFDLEDKDGFISDIYMLYSSVSVLACSVIIMFNTLIAKLLYVNAFFEAWKYVPFLLVGTVFNGISLFLGCLFAAAKHTKIISRSTLIGAIVNIGLNFALIPQSGALGAALATMIGYIVTWICRCRLLKTIMVLKIEWGHVVFGYLCIIVQAIIAIINSNYVLNMLFIIVELLTLRKYFRKILKRIKAKIGWFLWK